MIKTEKKFNKETIQLYGQPLYSYKKFRISSLILINNVSIKYIPKVHLCKK